MATGAIRQTEGSANSLDVEALARFAVDDHNTKQNALLEFKKVSNVKEQVVARIGSDYAAESQIFRILKLDNDGNLRIYSFAQGRGSFTSVWAAVTDQCQVYYQLCSIVACLVDGYDLALIETQVVVC